MKPSDAPVEIGLAELMGKQVCIYCGVYIYIEWDELHALDGPLSPAGRQREPDADAVTTTTQERHHAMKPSETPVEIGLAELMGKQVCIYCGVYIYAGKLVGLGPAAVKLESAAIVYETGPLKAPQWTDAQPLPGPHWWVSLGSIESFGPGKEC